jgi:hypothetical protein
MTQFQGLFYCLSTSAEPSNAFELQSFVNEETAPPDPNAFEEPNVKGTLFFGVHHGTSDCYCNVALTS